MYDVIITDAKLASRSTGLFDVAIQGGKILEVGKVARKAASYIAASGGLLSPGFVNAHTHLDKANLLRRMPDRLFGGSLEENRKYLRELKRDYSRADVCERAEAALREMVAHGVTAVRTQVDVDPTARLSALEALLELREKLGASVRIELCAFPQEGLLRKEAQELLEAAIKAGADLIGGLPLVEATRAEAEQHIDIVLETAQRHEVRVEMQVDESNDPRNFILPYLVERTLATGFEGRVTATHCISLSAVPDGQAMPVIEKMRRARMAVVVTPSANMITRSDLPPEVGARRSNSITRVRELIDAGIDVAIGTDNIRDVFYPLGNGSMLRELHVLATSLRMTGRDDPELLIQMATTNGAKLLGLNYGLERGAEADLVLLESASPREAVSGPDYPAMVMKAGRVVATTRIQTEFPDWRPDASERLSN